jgi:[acyl-carrier-protein] S-malonyltransferase
MNNHWGAVFPGQGSQHPGMGKELFDNFKVAQRVYEEASDAIHLDLKRLCFESPESELKLTSNTQPALLVTSIAAWNVFTSECELRPEVALGHSLGEYSALVAAGALTLRDAVMTARLRGQAMQEAVPVGTGGMTVILGMDDGTAIKACEDMQGKAWSAGLKGCVLEVANFNCPGQVVVSGHQKTLDYLKEHLIPEDYGVSRVKLLPLAVSAPFHCSLMKPAAERLKDQLEKVKWNPTLTFDVINNLTAEKNHDGSKLKQLLYEQMTKPVLWSHSIRNAHVQQYVEFGAGRVLAGLIKKIGSDLKTFSVGTSESLGETMEALK